MKKFRINSFMAGFLYLLGTVFGITSAAVGGKVISSLVQTSPLEGASILQQVANGGNELLLGSFFVLLMGISLVAMTVFLYPVFKKDSEELALGMLLFRGALEGTWYFITTIGFIGLFVLGVEYSGTVGSVGAIDSIGNSLYHFLDLLGSVGTILFITGTTCIYISFYRTKLIPKWLSIWGLIGVVPYLLYAILHFFELDNGIGFYLQMPLALQEMVMALWLMIKGFNSLALNKLLGK